MRGFSSYASATVRLERGAESIELQVHPLPFGWYAMLDQMLPPPKPPLNSDKPDPGQVARHTARQNMLILAKALGSQLDTPEPPASAGPGLWEAYADKVAAEIQAAHLVEGDCKQILDVLGKLNRGLGDLPKA